MKKLTIAALTLAMICQGSAFGNIKTIQQLINPGQSAEAPIGAKPIERAEKPNFITYNATQPPAKSVTYAGQSLDDTQAAALVNKLSAEVEELNLSDNNIGSLKGFLFPKNLRTLFVAGNSLQTLEAAAFPSSLQTLDLSSNQLSSLAGETLPQTLIVLDLSSNQLTSLKGLPTGSATHAIAKGSILDAIEQGLLPTMVILDFNEQLGSGLKEVTFKNWNIIGLEGCGIADIEGITFPEGAVINLSSNNITTISDNKIAELARAESVTLSGNPLTEQTKEKLIVTLGDKLILD